MQDERTYEASFADGVFFEQLLRALRSAVQNLHAFVCASDSE